MSFLLSDEAAIPLAHNLGRAFGKKYDDIYGLIGQAQTGDPQARRRLDQMKRDLASDLDDRGWLRDNLSAEDKFEYDREKSRQNLGESYNCPTGECRRDRACAEVRLGERIDPYSREHIERNACNRCPKTPPKPVYVIQRSQNENHEVKYISHYEDTEGNWWAPDSWFTASKAGFDFHGDPVFRDTENQTYRVIKVASGDRGGWQCRYQGGKLDDTSRYMGTYDYASAPGVFRAIGNKVLGPSQVENLHNDMDVAPHEQNGYYVPNLTEVF